MGVESSIAPSGREKELLDLIGQLGKDELVKLQEGKLFELDDATRAQLDNILKIRTDAAEGALGFGLEQATGQAAAGHAVFMCLHDLNLAARWCDHLLLRYPGGEACWGPAQSMLVPAALERLYGQKLVTVEADGAPVFIPAR